MFASKLWAMFSTRSPGVFRVGRGYGQLTTDDLRAMLQGLERGSFLMGMVHEAGDMNSFWELERCLWLEINKIGAERHWVWPEKTRDRRLADLVLVEMLAGRCCPKCFGAGVLDGGSTNEQCDICDGRGVVSMRQEDRAAFVGLGVSEWYRMWSKRYIACCTVADVWLETARRHLSVRVRTFREVA